MDKQSKQTENEQKEVVSSAPGRIQIEVTKELILHVAKQARVTLTDEEVKRFVPQFKEILDSFSKLGTVDTSGVEYTIQPIPLSNALRKDVLEPCLSVEDALFNAQHKKENYFKGPKVI